MSLIKGRIHSIETFGTVDGPGIRFIVFLQGCPLRCRYCHNRDTWDVSGGKEISAEEIIENALKYRTYFDASGGGITISGGEPTLQLEFAEEIFRLAKQNNLHTCLDTSGFQNITKLEKLLSLTDLVLLDIKHMNAEKSTWLTGYSSQNAMKIAEYLSEKKISMWLRHVLVPTITDDEENLIQMANFVKRLNFVQRFEFLPYHTMGVHKWQELGKEYTLDNIRAANDEDVERAKKIFLENGVSPELFDYK